MSDFTIWCPDIDQQQKNVWRQKIAVFGDGYSQRQLDGINALDKEFMVNYSGKSQSVLLAMQTYLEARKGFPFPFYDRGLLITYSVFCDEWSIQWLVSKTTPYGNLSATFRKANGAAMIGGAP